MLDLKALLQATFISNLVAGIILVFWFGCQVLDNYNLSTQEPTSCDPAKENCVPGTQRREYHA